MTTMTDAAHDRIPELTLPWRMRIALVDAGISVQAMADALEVSRATASRWMSGKGRPPRTLFIKQWALMTGTDVPWMLTGQQGAPHPAGLDEGLGAVRREGIEPPTRWFRAGFGSHELATVTRLPLRKPVTVKADPSKAAA